MVEWVKEVHEGGCGVGDTMSVVKRLKEEFSFIREKLRCACLKLDSDRFRVRDSCRAYYALYVLGLGATETIVGTIGLFSFWH